MLYVFNTLIVPVNFDKYKDVVVEFERLGVEEARELVRREEFWSVVGHEGTAKVLTQLLGVEVKFQRQTVFLEPGDMGLHFFLKQRLPEGAVLSDEELVGLDFWFVKSEVK